MILLIRHGETALNAAAVVQPPDTPLSERGIRQAQLLAGRLANMDVQRVLTSDLSRALATASAIAEATGAPTEVSALLQERNFGIHRGTPYAELRCNIFADDYEPPEGEALGVFDRRVDRAWRWILDCATRTSGNLAVVTHGLVCRSLAMRLLHLGAFRVPVRFGNTSLTIADPDAPYYVSCLDCCAHLEDEDGDRAALQGV